MCIHKFTIIGQQKSRDINDSSLNNRESWVIMMRKDVSVKCIYGSMDLFSYYDANYKVL